MNGSSLRYLIRTETDAMRSVISAKLFSEYASEESQSLSVPPYSVAVIVVCVFAVIRPLEPSVVF